MLRDVEIDPAGTRAAKSASHTFEGVMISSELKIRFATHTGKPVLSGVEIVRTGPAR